MHLGEDNECRDIDSVTTNRGTCMIVGEFDPVLCEHQAGWVLPFCFACSVAKRSYLYSMILTNQSCHCFMPPFPSSLIFCYLPSNICLVGEGSPSQTFRCGVFNTEIFKLGMVPKKAWKHIYALLFSRDILPVYVSQGCFPDHLAAICHGFSFLACFFSIFLKEKSEY